MRILFVDDDAFYRQAFLATQQSFRHFQLEVVSDAAQAIERMTDAGPFAVIVTDFFMPDTDGLEFLRKAREVSPESVRLLLSSGILPGSDEFKRLESAVESGLIWRYLQKDATPRLIDATMLSGCRQYLDNVSRELDEFEQEAQSMAS